MSKEDEFESKMFRFLGILSVALMEVSPHTRDFSHELGDTI